MENLVQVDTQDNRSVVVAAASHYTDDENRKMLQIHNQDGLMMKLALEHVKGANQIQELTRVIIYELKTAHALEQQFRIFYFMQAILVVLFLLPLAFFSMHEIETTLLLFVQIPLLVILLFIILLCNVGQTSTAKLLRLQSFTYLLISLSLTMLYAIELLTVSRQRRLFVTKALLMLQSLDTLIAFIQMIAVVQLGRAWFTVHCIQMYGVKHGLVGDKRA